MATPFSSLCTAAGLNADDVLYLNAKGFNTIPMIARAGKNDDEFLERIVKPFCDGITIGGTTFKVAGDIVLAEARFLILYDEAINKRRNELAVASAPPPTTLALRTQSSAAGPMLDPKVYHELIDKWQDAWLPKRVFPHHLIQGADSVLARLLDEHTNSKFYTPLHLGEVVQSRAHNTDGSINLSRVDKPRRDERVVLTPTGIEYESASPDPLAEADRWKIFDAITANAYALRWADYVSDHVAQLWTDWLIAELRTPGGVEIFKIFYHTCSWRLAFAMRTGTKFDIEAKLIMKDDEWVRKTKLQIKEKLESPGAKAKSSQQQPYRPVHRSRSPPRAPPARQYRSRSPRGPPPISRKQPQGKKDTKTITPGATKDRMQRSRSRGGTGLCRQFNVGKCRKRGKGQRGDGLECNYSHECGKCARNGCVGFSRCAR
jgi:hypothetical protein